jgi:hypothetical protein
MRPPAAGRRGSGRNPGTGGAGVWGERWGKPRGSPRACFGGSEGRWEARRGSSAAPGAGHRGGGNLQRGGGRFGQRTAGAASTGSQGGAGAAGQRQKEREGALTGQPTWRPAAEQGGLVGVLAREEGNGEAL